MNIMVSVGKISHAIANLTYMGQGKGKLNLVLGTTVTNATIPTKPTISEKKKKHFNAS